MDFEKNRNFMKANFLELENIETEQERGERQPSLEKPVPPNVELIDLVSPVEFSFPCDLKSVIENRKSRRNYSDKPLSLAELSFLLWSSQGVKDIIVRHDKAFATLRTVPSGGARHPFETYLIINNVTGLKNGIYRYIATKHKLLFLFFATDLKNKIVEATLGQKFIGESAAVFIWSVIPHRGEWRYAVAAHKTMLLDAGHICQNLYLACEVINAGTCAIAAYDQEKTDKFLKLDGKDEFTVYLAPVGKL